LHLVTRDEQITAALELLAPPPRDRAECLHDINVALDSIDFNAAAARSFKLTRSKAGKKKLGTYRAALRRVQAAYRALDPAVRPWLSLPQGIEREIAIADDLLAQQSRRSGGSDASRNEAAVREAHNLLKWRGYEVACTRGGKWARLAAILAGDQDLDLYDHMLDFRQRPAPSLVKVVDSEGSIVKIVFRR
jgi:hypothetical protein